MSRNKLLSVVLILLLFTALCAPAVNAQNIWTPPADVVVLAAPAVASVFSEVVIDGITVIVASVTVIEVSKYIDRPWVNGSWDTFVQTVLAKLNPSFAGKWVQITSSEAQTLMTSTYECYTASGPSGGKKDDKWYFEARLTKDPNINQYRIEINTKRLDIDQAAQKMKEGKNVMTLNLRCANDVLARSGIKPTKSDLEVHKPKPGLTEEDMFPHYNFKVGDLRLHIWLWKIE